MRQNPILFMQNIAGVLLLWIIISRGGIKYIIDLFYFDTVYYYDGDTLLGKNESGDMFFFHPDHLGSNDLMTDTSGNTVEETFYYPFINITITGINRRLTPIEINMHINNAGINPIGALSSSSNSQQYNLFSNGFLVFILFILILLI